MSEPHTCCNQWKHFSSPESLSAYNLANRMCLLWKFTFKVNALAPSSKKLLFLKYSYPEILEPLQITNTISAGRRHLITLSPFASFGVHKGDIYSTQCSECKSWKDSHHLIFQGGWLRGYLWIYLSVSFSSWIRNQSKLLPCS